MSSNFYWCNSLKHVTIIIVKSVYYHLCEKDFKTFFLSKKIGSHPAIRLNSFQQLCLVEWRPADYESIGVMSLGSYPAIRLNRVQQLCCGIRLWINWWWKPWCLSVHSLLLGWIVSSSCVAESGCESTSDGSRDVSRFTACYWAESCPAAVLWNQAVNQLVMEAVVCLVQ